MSDKLIILRNEAKQSMQALVDKALLQDSVSKYKRYLFHTSYRFFGIIITSTMAMVTLYHLPEAESVRHHFHNGLSNIFIATRKSKREMLAPDIYEKEMMLRRQESHLFR